MQISSIEDALSSLQSISPVRSTSDEAEFSDILQEALDDISETEANVLTENDNLLTGETDSIHTAVIASEKAELALSLAVQIRNKVLDAYTEIMNMQV